MAGHISDFFGYLATDRSYNAISAAKNHYCPFLDDTCTKTLNDGLISGACAIKPVTSGSVICCPIRLYADDYRILRDVADMAFTPGLDLVAGPAAIKESERRGTSVIGVFGQRWGGELRLPKRSGSGNYFVDWILALINPGQGMAEFVAVEVQTIDTTGNYRPSRSSLLEVSRNVVQSTAGLNWENVNKRILPQLIYKGQVLQREVDCKKGLFFVCPTPVYGKIMDRLGGQDGLTEYHFQPGAITFLGYNYDDKSVHQPGVPVPLAVSVRHTTTVYKLQDRFNNVVLPEANVYRKAIKLALGD